MGREGVRRWEGKGVRRQEGWAGSGSGEVGREGE